MSLDAATFDLFFQELHGYPPFPWQSALLRRVLETGRWPSTLDLPTGVGKTSAIEIAVYWLAADTQGRAPRRILAIVDRRVIVDQTHTHAKELAEKLQRAPAGGALRAVADALRAKTRGRGAPLATVVLRGGMVRDDSWAETPDQPLVVCSTVDQVGSRLLFRGYGVSSRMAPVHAGLVGMDCLYLLDEVHLSRPFAETLAAVGRHYRTDSLPERWQVVAMSATSGASEDLFTLSEADRAHEVLRRRLEARRPATLEQLTGSTSPKGVRQLTAKAAVRHAKALLKEGHRAIGVIVNRVDTARRVHAALHGKVKANVGLLTGRMRPIDKELVAPLVTALRAGRAEEPESPIILVSTQCIEAGADLDFSAMVTSCAALDALRQRFGRMNRLGERPGCRAVILCPPMKGSDPVYGEAMVNTRDFLFGLAEEGAVDFHLTQMDDHVRALSQEDLAALVSPSKHAPVLLPGLMELWAQTHPRPYPDPEVAPWLHGPERGVPEVQLVWRQEVTPEALAAVPEGDTPEALILSLEACPPASQEALSVPLYAAQAWLGEGAPVEVADVDVTAEAAKLPGERLALRWRGGDSRVVGAQEVRPGDTLVVPVSYGGLRPGVGVWDPASTAPVDDRGDEVQWLQRERAVLRSASVPALAKVLGRADIDERFEDAMNEALDGLRDEAGWLGEVATHLRGDRRPGWLWLPLPEGGGVLVGRTRRRRAADFVAGQDTGSFIGRAVTLSEHLSHVESWARTFVEGLELPEALAADLVLAASLHDLGKADPRFQQILAGGDPVQAALQPEPLAKSAWVAQDRGHRAHIQARSGYPKGARHELMSVALLQSTERWRRQAHDWELVLHLVGSHHGWCRPFAPPVADPEPVTVAVTHRGEPVSQPSDHGLALLGSGVAERFWRLNERYGAHGLAWLESIMRLADHRGSATGGVQ